ncbi:hypothetical protein MCOR03_007395 [Pyricularia oryzae]|nr:hypothetical protein MCOR03_007395 [Pyricularia oryzae]
MIDSSSRLPYFNCKRIGPLETMIPPYIEPNVLGLVKLTAVLLPIYLLGHAVYNLFFHPLRRFPGPRLQHISYHAYAYRLSRGTLAHDVAKWHRQYGPVVRISPDQLSSIEPDAWKDICGHRTGSKANVDEMPKWPGFYTVNGRPRTIINETKENHAVLRRSLAHGFSDRSMRLQEPIIGSYVDLLIRRLKERCHSEPAADRPGGLTTRQDIKTWYNWTTFDVIGDLAFGEPFDCLEKAEYHPWVDNMNKTTKSFGAFMALKLVGFHWLVTAILKYGLSKTREDHMRRTMAKIERRASLTVERPDLIEGLLQLKGLGKEQIRITAGTLIIAGSETTATLLSGVTYLLLKNPEKLARLNEEVRSAFNDDNEITLMSVANLPYMLACLDEAARLYPPVAGGTPRVVPAGGASIAGTYVPENTVVSVWQMAAYQNEQNFHEPFSFKPERFIERNSKVNTRDRFEVLQPFSVGPRNCIGRNLAYAEMRLILAKILFNFDIELADKEKDWIDHKSYVLWDKPALDIYLTPVRP